MRSAAASRYIAESAASTIYELGSQQTHRGKGPKIGSVAEEIGPANSVDRSRINVTVVYLQEEIKHLHRVEHLAIKNAKFFDLGCFEYHLGVLRALKSS